MRLDAPFLGLAAVLALASGCGTGTYNDSYDKVLADLLVPYRKKDADEAMKYIRENGGVEGLTMSFYKNLDIGNDGVWDVWQLESPNMIWYFRGAPHVHTWVNIRANKA